MEKIRTQVIKKFVFDATDGKAIGTHVIGQLPSNAVIRQAWIDVDTTFTSATDAATIALGYTSTVGAFDAAIAISAGGNVWDAAVPRVSDAAADGAVGNFVVLSADVKIFATVAVEALTAGKVSIYVDLFIDK